MKSKRKKWTKEDEKYLRENWGKIPSKIICNNLDRSYSSVNTKACLLKIKGSGISKRKYHFNENFFSNYNYLSSYWAGFIAADGYVQEHPQKELSIKLNSKDKKHLSLFKKDLDYSGSLKSGKYGKDKIYSRIRLCHADKIVFDLNNKFNIFQKKSLTLEPPSLSGKNALCYIKGYLDGDGWITIYKNRIFIGVCGTKGILEWIQNTLLENNHTKIFSRGNAYQWSISGEKAFYIKQKLDFCPRRLDRKWSKADKFFD